MTKVNEEIVEEAVVAETAAEVAAEAAEEKKPARKRTSKKAESVEGAEEKPAKKTTRKTKKAEETAEGAEEKPVKKTTTRKKAVKVNVNLQFAGKEYTADKLVEIAKDVWQYDLGNDIADFKSVELYVKTEESSVYYVINEEISGKFAI